MREASFSETVQPRCASLGAAVLHGLLAPGARELRVATLAVRELHVSDRESDLMAFSSRSSSLPEPATAAASGHRGAGQFGETTAHWPG